MKVARGEVELERAHLEAEAERAHKAEKARTTRIRSQERKQKRMGDMNDAPGERISRERERQDGAKEGGDK